VGAPARSDEATVAKAEYDCRGTARGTVNVMQGTTLGYEPADRGIEVTFLGDVERVAIVGAQRDERRGVLVEDFGQGVEILADRPLADEDGHALHQLFAGLAGGGRLMVGADAGGEVTVELEIGEQGGVAVDVTALEGLQLGYDAGVGGEDAGVVHHLGEA